MNSTICASISSYTDVSCSDAETVSAIALPVIQIGVVLIVIIALATVGIIIKKYTKKVHDVVNAPLSEVVEKLEQEDLLSQRPE
ncbi:MAG: hypothetical protein LBQ11_02170 [Candidatus Nomurabacteria bacterium]|jgi:hypothetical protein|nr:hypothetical protein [Candidatus Nomurabacteria bacterium]